MGLSKHFSDVAVLTMREVKKWVGRRAVLLISLATPLMWITLFGHSFSPLRLFSEPLVPGLPAELAETIRAALVELVVSIFGTTDYFTYVASGMVVVFTLFNSSMSGAGVVFDKRLGYLERLRALPVSRSSIFASRVLGALFRITVLTALLLLAAAAMGFEFKRGITPLDLLAAWAVVMMFAAGLSSLYVALAFRVNHHEALFAVANLVNLPLMFSSNALFPVEQMPWWLRAAAEANPLSHAVSLVRYHLVGSTIESYALSLLYLASISLVMTLAGWRLSVKSMEE